MQNKKIKLIFLSGKKGSGKSSVSKYFVEEHGFIEIRFADYLKKICNDVLENIGCQTSQDHFELHKLKESLIKDESGEPFEIETFSQKRKKNIKSHITYRQFMQLIGTELFRNNIRSDIWTLPVINKLKNATLNRGKNLNGIVISDLRYPNEHESVIRGIRPFLKFFEITTVYIDRDNINKELDSHSSENSMSDFEFDVVLKNDSDLKTLLLKSFKIITGEWRLDKHNHEVKIRAQDNFLNKYKT